MSRYIGADHLRKWMLSWWERTEPTSEYLKGRDILNQIDREPSIDIVRCGECKYYVKDYTGEWCGRFRYPHGCKADGFCSYGVHSDSEKPNNSTDYRL